MQTALDPIGEQSGRGMEGDGPLWSGAAEIPVQVSPSDEDKLSHTDVGESGDSSDHESVVDRLGGLPHVTPQTAEDII
ncbi:hypothetical protein NDU88_007014 [Pleurodeles waltl]|uniref:Uncharacterized protein n=1 Tax=Pleurodeles waltl TaxID=8319 RepID=A0AAV7QNF7_PLEWA|nr:hypothetical protein NDU88_007014 [Pleurodeles waltl]